MSMTHSLVQAAHRLWRCAGIDFYRISPHTSPAIRLAMLAKLIDSTLLFDIGANEGQFAKEVLASGYRGRIVSVEPGKQAHQRLLANSAGHESWTVAAQCALGTEAGHAKLNIAGNSMSSSLRPMKEAHEDAAPEARYVATETVDVITLDALFASVACDDDQGIILKVDVQGHEAPVLSGGAGSLSRISAILMEMSLVELYEGQSLLADQLATLSKLGFGIWDLDRGFMDVRTGRLLQVDATFVRQGAC